MNKYTYKKSDGEEIWTVGHDDNGKWIPESDWENVDHAVMRSKILNREPRSCYEYLVNNIRIRIEEMHEGYRAGYKASLDEYERGAADACGLILDLAELRLFLPAKDGGE